MTGRRCGFTLIELLVVVSIIAILAAILFPVFAQTRRVVVQTRCLSNLRQLALAHRLYVQDFDDTLPFWSRPERGGWDVLWPEFLRPYYRDPRLLDEGVNRGRANGGAVWQADYALCTWGSGGDGTLEKPYWRWPGSLDPQTYRPMRLAAVRRPAETMQIADGVTLSIGPFTATCSVQHRHQDGALNGVFLDGHARQMTDATLNQLRRDDRGYFYVIAATDR